MHVTKHTASMFFVCFFFISKVLYLFLIGRICSLFFMGAVAAFGSGDESTEDHNRQVAKMIDALGRLERDAAQSSRPLH